MYALAFIFSYAIIIDSLVIVKIHRNAIYDPFSPCAFIRNTTWSKQESIQSCIWECVHEYDCQTAIFFKDENICSTFAETCITGKLLPSGTSPASVICYRKDHNPIVQCSTSAIPHQSKEIEDTSTNTRNQVYSTITKSVIITTKTPRIPQNLLINPGGELGSLSSWIQTDSAHADLDHNGNFQSGYQPHLGGYCFVGGNVNLLSYQSGLIQNVNLLAGIQNFTTNELDSGTLMVNVSFYYQSYEYYFGMYLYDSAEIDVIFRSSPTVSLSTETISNLICPLSSSQWCFYTTQYSLPIGTRSIDYKMTFYGLRTKIAAYIDDNSLEIV